MLGDIIPFFKAIFEAMPQEYGFLFLIKLFFNVVLRIASEKLCYRFLCESRSAFGYYGKYKEAVQPTGNEKFSHKSERASPNIRSLDGRAQRLRLRRAHWRWSVGWRFIA
jgi:hypothetical protein